MITLKEYLELDKKSPWYAKEYDGDREKDKELIIEYNKALLEKYPWLTPYNVWTGKLSEDYDYSFTWLDSMDNGWRIAFGEKMCEEIQKALVHAQEVDPEGGYEESWITTNYDSDKKLSYVEGFRITEIKEKYGTLRFYCGSAPEEVFKVIDKYETMSADYCIRCGKPTKWVTRGWINYFCDECKQELEVNEDFYDTFDLIKRRRLIAWWKNRRKK